MSIIPPSPPSDPAQPTTPLLTSAPAQADQQVKPKRPWYKMKRYVVLGPILFLLFIGWVGSLSGAADDTETSNDAKPAATNAAETPLTAEEKAAEEAAEAAKAEQDAADKAAKTAQETADAAAKAAAEAAAAAAAEAARGTTSQQNATRTAQSYINMTGFSRAGLIKQLEYEGYPPADANWGADHASVDWNSEAAQSAKSYLDMTSFSRSGLIDQLLYEGYTPAEAEYGVSQTGL